VHPVVDQAAVLAQAADLAVDQSVDQAAALREVPSVPAAAPVVDRVAVQGRVVEAAGHLLAPALSLEMIREMAPALLTAVT
jgi:hypothetical protein